MAFSLSDQHPAMDHYAKRGVFSDAGNRLSWRSNRTGDTFLLPRDDEQRMLALLYICASEGVSNWNPPVGMGTSESVNRRRHAGHARVTSGNGVALSLIEEAFKCEEVENSPWSDWYSRRDA